jgi:hypothetical protein
MKSFDLRTKMNRKPNVQMQMPAEFSRNQAVKATKIPNTFHVMSPVARKQVNSP